MSRFCKFAVLIFVGISLSGLKTELSADNKLRSAFLGPSVWEDGLSSQQVNLELREHFSEVITRLESKNASSLLTALIRAEAASTKKWTKSDRRAALVYLAYNRQTQIERLRGYMHRGLFPVNEGQANEAVPIFVDQRKTHCAVGYLMHVDGKDGEVAEVVGSNNLVKVMDANVTGLTNWVRSSGLTREEAAMIQPGYPFVNVTATFGEFATPGFVVEENGLILSDVTVRRSRFDTTLPVGFPANRDSIQPIFNLGRSAVESNNANIPVGSFGAEGGGVLFGSGETAVGFPYDSFGNSVGSPNGTPGNLDDWLYLGNNGLVPFGFLDASGAVEIVEIEYRLQSERGNFSEIALTSVNGNRVLGEQNAILALTQIFQDGTNDLLGEAELFAAGEALVGSDSIELDTDSVRIKTYGLVLGGDSTSFQSFFNEFETTAVPEPTTTTVIALLGIVVFARRRR